MRRFFTTCLVLICLRVSFAQQIQGNAIQGNVMIGGNVTLTATGHSVLLSWGASQNATSYSIYRGTTHGGPYLQIASGIAAASYTDIQILHGQTLFYVVTAVTDKRESEFSNETVATIP